MNQFFESSVVPASDPARLSRPEEQVSHRLADLRLERRERAMRAAVGRAGERRDV